MQLLDLVHADGAVADDVPVVRQGHAGEGAGALVWHLGKGRGAGMRILLPPQAQPPSITTSNKLTSSAGALSWGTYIKQRQPCCKEPGPGGTEQGLAPLHPGVLGKGSGEKQWGCFLVLWCLAARWEVFMKLCVVVLPESCVVVR